MTQQWHLVKDAVDAVSSNTFPFALGEMSYIRRSSFFLSSSSLYTQIDKHIMTVKRREDRDTGGLDTSSDPDPIRSMSDREKLQLRTWLLHWCLFCYPVSPEEMKKREDSGDKW